MLYPYKMGSVSAAALSEKLGVKQIRHTGSKFKGNEGKVIINWGASSMSEEANKCTVINKPEAVKNASNKLKFFEMVKGQVNIPEFTTAEEEARGWLEDGSVVFGRSTLTGHSGKGIIIMEEVADWGGYNHSQIPLYVKYIPKKDEYRVHVVGDSVVDVRRKALKSDHNKEGVNWKVRNLNNGFIYVKEGLDVPNKVYTQALLAIEKSGLDFGAVDVIWNNFREEAYVLEINTAPGLEGSTIDNYAAGFARFLNENTNTRGKRFGKTHIDEIWASTILPTASLIDIELSDGF